MTNNTIESNNKATTPAALDWTGNKQSSFCILGASNHSLHVREQHDYYATDPIAVRALLEKEAFSHRILEPACGEGHISKELERAGYDVTSTDLIYRGYGSTIPHDFLASETATFYGDIVTNPPYKYASKFVQKAIETVADGHKVAMLLKLLFLESKGRKALFERYPPTRIHVFSERIPCALNGDFEHITSSAVCYAWFVWEKGFTGNPQIDWI